MTDETQGFEQAPPPKRSGFRDWAARIPRDLIPLLVLTATIFLVILFASDWKFWDGQGGTETTNDAYIRSDVTPLSTKVSGTVSKVLINDFDRVVKGQVIAELRNDDYIARATQAEAQYKQAVESISTVSKQIDVQKQRIETARLSTSISSEDITKAGASVAGTAASLQAARASLEAARAERAQAQARLKADQAIELHAAQEKQRQTDLFADKASTQQTVEQVVADYDRTKSIVEADREEINRLTSLILERTAEITKLQEDVKSTQASDVQAGDALKSKDTQLLAEQKQLEVLKDQLKESQEAAAAKKAAWDEALVELDYTRIVAPVDGVLSERRVRAGQQVNAGTQVVTIVSAVPWVIASFRETQMRKMDVGEKAEVSVDALGGAVLKGTIQSMSPASEAQFALLPPDNPSGNFTKITQRVPIKIVFEPEQKLLPRVKSGMTVIVKVWTK